jgi:uncharacterized protein (DUF305 family)
MRIGRTALVVVFALGVVAGCGGDDAGETSESFNAADVEFGQGMIAHHEQAIEMSEMALDPSVGATADVVDLATRIQAAQDPEIEQMSGWLTAWDEPVEMDMSDGHDMAEMPGMMSATQMDELAALTGADFDARWLAMMIEHHRGAIEMSETVLTEGANGDVLSLAQQIIDAQQGEITEMESLLA